MSNLEHLNEADRAIAPEEVLIRNIHFSHVLPDGSLKTTAFKDRNMSVNRERLLEPIHDLRDAPPHVGGAKLTAEFCAAQGADLEPDPDFDVPDPPNLAHALVKTTLGKNAQYRYAEALRARVMETWDLATAASRAAQQYGG